MYPNPQYIKQVLSHHARLNYFSVCLYKTVLKKLSHRKAVKKHSQKCGEINISIMLFFR